VKYQMKTIVYSSGIWEGSTNQPKPELLNLFEQKDTLIELVVGKQPYQVVVGVPHQAKGGVDKIGEDWKNEKGEYGRPSDENVGIVALVVWEVFKQDGISARFVIAAHATDHDPNKTPGCPYWESVFATPLPALYIELHGAKNNKDYEQNGNRHDIELSSGMNQVADPLKFGRLMAYERDGYNLGVQKKPGSNEAFKMNGEHEEASVLDRPALKTLSLTHAGELNLPAFHLELKPMFRQYPNILANTWRMARMLSAAIQGYNDSEARRTSSLR
jgi:hypothetical protein